MSDNGGGVRGLLKGGKGDVWEAGIRVPLIVRGPGIAANSWCHARVVGFDLFNTFCELAGVTEHIPPGVDGKSITHLLRGQAAPVKRPSEELVFHFPHYQGDSPHTALFLGDYKLIRHYEDIGELHNLAPSQPDIAANLLARMDNYLENIGAQAPKLPLPNPQFDSENEPDIREANNSKKGGGTGKGGKSKGDRKPKR